MLEVVGEGALVVGVEVLDDALFGCGIFCGLICHSRGNSWLCQLIRDSME